ncbi:uncharacterized protein LOC133525001 isoform X2 [Cydia pomonella]|uniref:uncharacterized protein LOC133525001 isoform X2 n=1 Tax=Cydia pomonella TaxID=82600 RepID=UPI002ADE52E3|nr:uncharacterized protein LOC133525001 isoform X2 [Cydia pomonella]
MESDSEREINIENFIQVIQNRPAIWDMSKREYSDRIAKKKAWEEISTLFITDFATKNTKQKNEEALKLQKKWKSIRDAYTRDRNKKSKSGSGATTSRDYVYSHCLSFLNRLSNTRPLNNSQKENQNPRPNSRKETVEVNSDEDNSENLIKILTARMENKKEKNNPDYNFFISLLDDFNTISSEYKMDAKMEIMSIIKKYMQMSKYSNQNSNNNGGYFTPMGTSFSSHVPHAQTPETSQNFYTSSPSHSQLSDTTQEPFYSDLFCDDGEN